MSDFQMPVYNDEQSSRERVHEFDDLPSLQEFVNSLDPKRREFIEKLPTLSEDDLKGLNQADSFCPICYNTFGAIMAEAELASALDTPAVAHQHLGVTRLAETCGHVFCRKDITTWIERNDKCPTCRTPFYEAPASHGEGGTALPGLQSFTLSNLMPDFHQILRNTNATQTPDPASEGDQTTASAEANPAEPPANRNADTNGTPTTTASSGANRDANAQRAENDAEVARMMERMRNLGQPVAFSDIMFGLNAVAGRRQQREPDDDRNEYAGLYS